MALHSSQKTSSVAEGSEALLNRINIVVSGPLTKDLNVFFMRRFFLVFASVYLFALPVHCLAAESSGSGSGSTASNSAAAAFSGSSSVIQTPSITDSPSSRPKTSVSESNPRSEEREARSSGQAFKTNSSFQTYVASSTGTALEVFGRDLFSNVPSTFAPLANVQVNADYVIGTGDALQIRGWGMVDIDVNVTVSRSGEIYLPRVGSVNVAGVKYRDLQGYLKKAIGRIYKSFELSASISQTRSVQIYVVGHALRPGSYNLSAMSTLLNALFASGGPAHTGSMRNIKLKRGGESIVSFDLYDILLHGDKSSDLGLHDGDVIYIPAVGPQFALLGDVKKPAIFELKQKASIAEIVSWAGGFESSAGLKNVIVEKNIANQFQTIAELQADWSSIEKSLAQLEVQPTDIIRVFAPGSIPLEVKIERSFVRVDGAVKHSGVFELKKGETLEQLISRTGGITDHGYIFGTKLTRESVRIQQQAKMNEVVDRYEKDIQTNAKQRLNGQSDPAQAAQIAAELEMQRSLLAKLRSVKSEGRIILNLKNSHAIVTDLPELPLQDSDTVYIPQKPGTVEVLGAVYQQNSIMYQPDRNVSYYLTLAGGVSSTGEKSELYRICADGTVRSNHTSGMGGKVNPGDAIVVPEKIQRGQTFMQSLKDWTSILYQFGLGAAGLATLKTL